MKIIFIILCVFEVYYVVDLSFSEGLRNNLICVLLEDGAESAFCQNFFEENSFVLSKMMIYRSIFLPLFLVISALIVGGYYFIKEDYKEAVKLNAFIFFVAFVLFSLIALGY